MQPLADCRYGNAVAVMNSPKEAFLSAMNRYSVVDSLIKGVRVCVLFLVVFEGIRDAGQRGSHQSVAQLDVPGLRWTRSNLLSLLLFELQVGVECEFQSTVVHPFQPPSSSPLCYLQHLLCKCTVAVSCGPALGPFFNADTALWRYVWLSEKIYKQTHG